MAASFNNSNKGGEPCSIVVSQLPSLLLAELKSLLMGHFANFGRILRISCASKGNRERTAHIQFSSSGEAFDAEQNGKIMNGHPVIITLTDKIPTTQILSLAPQPIRSTLASVPSKKPTVIDKKNGVQSTLSAYFQRTAASKPETQDTKKEIKGSIPTASSVLNEALQCSSAPASSRAAGNTQEDKKPNVCLKLEVYQGSSKHSQPQSQTSFNSTSTTPVAATSNVSPVLHSAPVLRPSRSLREILNLDTTNMKVVKTVTASDALACQFFNAGKHPFPLSLMFGRIPGSVIMPVKSIMDSIKPGLKIKDSTLELVWNTVLQSVLKNVLPRTAKSVLQESIINKLALETYTQLENNVVEQEVNGIAEKAVDYEEDFLICCEDVMEALLGLVCEDLIEKAAIEEVKSFHTSKAISKVLECCFRKLTGVVVKEVVQEVVPGAVLDYLCQEVVDDVLDSPIFNRHVKVIATDALQKYRDEGDQNNESGDSGSSSSFSASKGVRALDNFIPLEDSYKLTKRWLETSSFDIRDDLDEIGSQSSIDSNISCLAGSSRCSSRQSIPSSENQANNRLQSNNAVFLDVASTEDLSKNVTDRSLNGFFGSLKRAASSLSLPSLPKFSLPNPFKRRKY